ncbi:MAG: hypothetical protein HW414_1624 [Dehalococcoidia bacterium]|nr:hypothetical protein [Dehalococcoidia bacterium]
MKLLLHSCCAYCAAYTADFWGRQGWEVTAFWYNPNIHPFREHQLRLEAMLTLAQKRALPLMVDEGYEVIDYFKAIRVVDKVRCQGCFRVRLGRTAQRARQRGFSAFTTTLFLSPYQKHKLLRLTGERIAEEEGIPFLHNDLRSGYRESHRLGHELHLYHQTYCGCVYSEWERYCPIERPKKLKTSPREGGLK